MRVRAVAAAAIMVVGLWVAAVPLAGARTSAPAGDCQVPVDTPGTGARSVAAGPTQRAFAPANAINNPSLLWPNGTVVYYLDPSIGDSGFIKQAMRHIEDKSCITFREYYQGAPNYVYIYSDNGCFSHVGKTGGQQPLSLGQGCHTVGRAIHELMHAIGFHHHHARSDRDQYLDIRLQNVDSKMRSQFHKLQPWENTLYTGFDYQSIMIYDSYAFSNNNQPTMIPRQAGVRLADPGTKYALSEKDVIALNRLYGCP